MNMCCSAFDLCCSAAVQTDLKMTENEFNIKATGKSDESGKSQTVAPNLKSLSILFLA